MTSSELNDRLMALGVDRGAFEFKFHDTRRWRFDLCWPEMGLAVELHGLGRHIRPVGYAADRDKVNAAILDGWRVLEFTPLHWTAERTDESIETILRAMGWRFEDA